MRQHNAASASASEPLPPDVEAARRARINNELIEIFRRPCPVDATASSQGVGLYTHVTLPPLPHSGHPQKASNPVFLSIGGPAEMSTKENGLEAPISDDMERAFEVVQEAVNKEKEHIAQTNVDINVLKERYGARHSENVSGISDAASGSGQQINGGRPSANQDLSGDVTMGGSGDQRRRSTGSAWTGNDYEAARDPRLHRR